MLASNEYKSQNGGNISIDISAPLDHTKACGDLTIEILLPSQLGYSLLQ